jgi:intracellular multiplication protein IcmK
VEPETGLTEKPGGKKQTQAKGDSDVSDNSKTVDFGGLPEGVRNQTTADITRGIPNGLPGDISNETFDNGDGTLEPVLYRQTLYPTPDENTGEALGKIPNETSGQNPDETLTQTLGGSSDDPQAFYDLSEAQARQDAYERSLRELLPTTPEEVKAYRRSLDARDEALSDSPPDSMRTRTVRVRLEPGFIPPLVELTPNLVTAMVFTDSTGRPWPVTASVLGSGSLYTSELLSGEPANRIIVAPLGNHGHSNLIVTLVEKDIPVVIRLKTASALKSGRQVDSLIVFQVQERGPEALPETLKDDFPTVADDILYSILDNLTPTGGKVLKANPGLDGDVYTQLGQSIYLRTKHALLWPAPRARVSGPGGVMVYEIAPVSSILLSRDDGVLSVSLEDAVVDPVGSWGAGH